LREFNHVRHPSIVSSAARSSATSAFFVVMQLKGLDTAFALGEHSRQAGFQVVP
jgi:hypothetical protein